MKPPFSYFWNGLSSQFFLSGNIFVMLPCYVRLVSIQAGCLITSVNMKNGGFHTCCCLLYWWPITENAKILKTIFHPLTDRAYKVDLGDTSLMIHRFDSYCNIGNNRFDCWLWKKHQKSFVSIVGFEKNIENHSFWLLAMKKTLKIFCFNFYNLRPGLR